jgi:preprotein translocase subunit SecA
LSELFGHTGRKPEHDVYDVFGCVVPSEYFSQDAPRSLERVEQEVATALAEQRERLLDVTDDVVSDLVTRTCPANLPRDDWDMEAVGSAFEEQFGFPPDASFTRMVEASQLASDLYEQAEQRLRQKEAEVTTVQFLRLFRVLYLQEIDRGWLEHLSQLDHLRDGIGLRGYGQLDPKKEYGREAFKLFTTSLEDIRKAVLHRLFRVERVTEEEIRAAEARRAKLPTAPAAQRKVISGQPRVGRNDPCPCGSGKKYKSCHLNADLAGR